MEFESRKLLPVRVYIDGSPESCALTKALKNRGIDFTTIYASPKISKVPTYETLFGTISGWFNICRYLLTPEECQLEPTKTPEDKIK